MTTNTGNTCPVCFADKVYARVVDRINGVRCEVEYSCPLCGVVGYWAYGYYDPECPYPAEVNTED